MLQLILPGVHRTLDLEPLLRPSTLAALAAVLMKYPDRSDARPKGPVCPSVQWGWGNVDG
jgi:hypothetical protein